MRRVEAGGKWSLFCPNEAPGLCDVHGAAFDELYERYEREGRARESVDAQKIWFAILESQMETGTPYMMFKDACNAKSNQRHLGTIRGSNLCTEIVEYTAPDEVAVCNLASIALPRFVIPAVPAVPAVPAGGGGSGGTSDSSGSSDNSGSSGSSGGGGNGGGGGEGGAAARFDLEHLHEVSRVVAKSLDRVIDRSEYPLVEARNSNLRHRPVGIGVQGLADAFALLGLPFEGAAAAELNREIFETIYHGALTASCDLAEQLGAHPSHEGSPASQVRT